MTRMFLSARRRSLPASSLLRLRWTFSVIMEVVFYITLSTLLLGPITTVSAQGSGGSSSSSFIGNEKATFSGTNDLDIYNSFYRQDLCPRSQLVQNGTIELRDALRGFQLHPLMRVGGFFKYTTEDGINSNDPGLMTLMMDELSRRAGFTWRNSFGVTYGPSGTNATFSDLLIWSINSYDISVNWWDRTLERLERGATFLQPWFDGSIILIDKQEDIVVEDTINLWNWLRPFTTEVWIITVITIIVSGLTYQWIEHLGGHRENRSWWQWFSDNVYLSAINFPQNYEFQPKTAAGRLFGVSISIWALVMTATYTANLASLLVDTKPPAITAESVDDAITLGKTLCTYANSGADAYISLNYKKANRYPLDSELKTFQALNDGLCDMTVAYYQNWLGYEKDRNYNPSCDLEWVGRVVKPIQSGFAVKADNGDLCTSLIRDVFNVYLDELIASGFVEDMWEAEYAKAQDINCDVVRPEILNAFEGEDDEEEDDEGGRYRRRLSQAMHPHRHVKNQATTQNRRHPSKNSRRNLKTSGRSGAAAVGGGASEEGGSSRLSWNQMAGTFILHFLVSLLSIVLGYVRLWYKSYGGKQQVQKMFNSKHDGGTTSHNNKNDHNNTNNNIYGETGEPKEHNPHLDTTMTTTSTSTNNHGDQAIRDYTDQVKDYTSRVHDKLKDLKNQNSNENSSLNTDTTRNCSSTNGNSSMDAWQITQRELQETKQELQDTRREMTQQMNDIMILLRGLKRQEESRA